MLLQFPLVQITAQLGQDQRATRSRTIAPKLDSIHNEINEPDAVTQGLLPSQPIGDKNALWRYHANEQTSPRVYIASRKRRYVINEPTVTQLHFGGCGLYIQLPDLKVIYVHVVEA